MLNLIPIIGIIVTVLVDVLLSVVVLSRNSKSVLNRTFFAMGISMALWSSASVISDTVTANNSLFDLSRITSSLAFGFGFLAVALFLIFTFYLNGVIIKRKILLTYFSITVFLTVIFSSDLTYDLVTIDTFETGPFYIPYIVILLAVLLMAVRNLLKSRRQGVDHVKKQSTLILAGSSIVILGGLVFNVLLPAIFTESGTVFTRIGPLFSGVFVVLVGLSIVKYKLFDFKAVLARSLSYILAVSIFTTVYVSILYLIRRIIFPSTSLTIGQLVSNVAVGLVIVATFPFIKRYFDKVTKKLFFRDAYDPQALLSELNRSLVSDAEIESLLTKAALVMQENFKADFCTFYIRQTSYFPNRFIGAHRKSPEIDDLEILNELSKKIHKKVHSTEVDPESEEERELNKVLRHNDVEVLARLVSRVDYEVNGIGFIFLGPKKSGSLYTAADLKILEIIANELVIAIENVLRFEEIEQFNVTLQKKIDAATNELQSSNDKLRALDEAKDEFVSMASHQLRTPLTSVKGYISMVLEGDAGKINDTQRQMLGQAMFSSQRMVYLIADLLNVSRLKTGKFIIEAKPIYLPDVVETELLQLHEGAVAKNITFAFDKPKKFPTIELDEMKIRQVIMNFTDNALYYTPNEGTITIELKDKKDSIEFTVKDNGIGVPKAEQHKLFAKFYRAENARKARPDGTGLGLFMAKKVVVAQGGSIIFESKEGKGSTFGFSFPKNRQIPQEAVTEDAQA